MEGYIDIDKWVDLSVLPTRKYGCKYNIDWKNSIGHKVPFRYNEIYGFIEIMKYTKNQSLVVYIDGYSSPDGDILQIKSLKECLLSRVLHKKIIDVAPELIQYMQDINDAYVYSPKSNRRINTICPFCGFKKTHTIANLYMSGFGCPQCSDGKSYAEKFMFHILKQLNIDFKYEVTHKHNGFEWITNNYRYDFYFEINNKKYFVELDGHFHKDAKLSSYQQTINSDYQKDHMAASHDIDMIRIDCCYNGQHNRYDYIKCNILNSQLSNILNLSIVDFDCANRMALNSNIWYAAKLWNNNFQINQIARKLSVAAHTVSSYLKTASSIGLCKYNLDIAEERRVSITKKNRSKPVALYNKDKLIDVFFSALDLSDQSEKLYGIHFARENIASACRTHYKCYGYNVEYITHEEYYNFLQQLHTIQN